MIKARRTDGVSRVIPTSDVVVAHTHRCFFGADGTIRIFEYVQPATITYPECVMVSFGIIFVRFDDDSPADITVVYVDANGWMIHEKVLENLLREQKVAKVI